MLAAGDVGGAASGSAVGVITVGEEEAEDEVKEGTKVGEGLVLGTTGGTVL